MPPCLRALQCVPAGWAFPWGLRVRLYEMLLRALFDSLDEAEYVPDKERYLQVLEVRLCEHSFGTVPVTGWGAFLRRRGAQAPTCTGLRGAPAASCSCACFPAASF